MNDFELMCRVGYGCGLKTLGEAYSQLCCHYDAFFLIEEANEKLHTLGELLVKKGSMTTIREAMGDAWCDEEDRLEKEFFEQQEALEADRNKLQDEFGISEDEDDFLSGVTCNPDAPEECESCQ